MSASIIDGQVYEVRPMANTSKNMAVGSSSHVDGAKVILYDALDINDQKWRFVADGSNWRIYNVESGKQAVVWWPTSASPLVDGQQIVQWGGGSTNAVWTAFQDNGETTTIDGVECPVIVIENTENPDVSLSTSDAIYYGSNLVKLATTDTGAQTQRWVCIPTLENGAIPAPYALGYSAAVGDVADGGNVRNVNTSGITGTFRAYPRWAVPDSYANSGKFLLRSRIRVYVQGKSDWNAWDSWTEWAEPATSRSGSTFWATTALTSNPNNTRKLTQTQYQVRMLANDSDGNEVASPAASCLITWWQRPVIEWSASSWSPTGLTIGADSTYSKTYTSGSTEFIKGPTYIHVDSIKIGGTEYLKEAHTSTLITNGDDVSIPQSKLLGIPDNNATMTITYRVGTDQRMSFDDVYTATSTVSYDAGEPTVTVTDTDGFTKTVTVANSDDARVWLLYDGQVIECPDGVVAYPFGKAYDIFASGTYGNPATPFAWHAHYDGNAAGVHAWTWDGGSASLQVREGEPIIVDDSIEAVYESYDLAGRAYETVDFAPTRHHKFTAQGAVIQDVTESDRDDFELVAGIHATYRSPRGDIVPVAIVSVSREAHRKWTEIDVSMIRESE